MLSTLLLMGVLFLLSAVPARAQVTLTVSGWHNIRGFDELVERFEAEHPDVRIEPLGTISGSYWDWLVVQAAGGTGPDVVWTNYAGVPRTAPAGVLLPIDDLMLREGIDPVRDSFLPVWGQMSYAGTAYAVPYYMAASGVYINMSMFDEAGLGFPSPNWNWDDLLAISDKLHRKNAAGQTIQWGFTTDSWNITSGKGVAPFLWSNGGDIIDAEGEFALNRPESLQALRWFVDATFNHPSVYTPQDHESIAFYNAFRSEGIIGMWSTASSNNDSLLRITTAENLFEWDVAPLPMSPYSGSVVTYLQSDGLGVGAFSAHPDLAWEFVKLAFSTWYQQEVLVGKYGLLPVRRDAVPNYLSGDFLPKNKQVFVDAAVSARDFHKLPNPARTQEFYDFVNAAWNADVMTQQEDIGNFVEKMRTATEHFFVD